MISEMLRSRQCERNISLQFVIVCMKYEWERLGVNE
jgi:hypothetical protein